MFSEPVFTYGGVTVSSYGYLAGGGYWIIDDPIAHVLDRDWLDPIRSFSEWIVAMRLLLHRRFHSALKCDYWRWAVNNLEWIYASAYGSVAFMMPWLVVTLAIWRVMASRESRNRGALRNFVKA